MTTSNTAPAASGNRASVTLARLIRIRKDEDSNQPSRIYAQLIGNGPNGQISSMAQADLVQDGEALLLSSEAWNAGEAVMGRLAEASIPLDDPAAAQNSFDSHAAAAATAEAHRQDKQDRAGLNVILEAIRESVLRFSEGNTVESDAFQRFLENHMARVQRYAVAPVPAAPSYNGDPANTFSDAPYIGPLPKDGTKGHLLEREALRYGMSSTRYPNGAFVVQDPATQKQLSFKWGRSPLASSVALSICSYKEATRRLLAQLDVPVPQGRVFSMADREQAVDFADRIGYPVVCKPVAGLRGIGVVANIKSRDELQNALDLYLESQLGDDDFVIEEHVPGEDYRIVVIDDEVVASVVRAPASVTGDGLHTVADLIEYKNRARQENPHLSSRPIKFSSSLEYQLQLAGLTYGSVPTDGQHVILANSANLSQGGDSFEIADELHPSIKELAVKAVKAVPGLGFCGLDMLIEDHTKPVWEQKATVIELNAHAAIGSAQYPMWGTPAPVAKTFFEATAANANIGLPAEQASTLSMHLSIRGRIRRLGYRNWFQRQATSFGLTGYVKRGSDSRSVEVYANGPADAVSAIGYLAMKGPNKAEVSSVTMNPVPYEEYDSFKVRRGDRQFAPLFHARRVAGGLKRRASNFLNR